VIENATARLDSPRLSAARPPAIEAKRERSRATREALLDALMELLRERPYGDIGVGDIARRAGLTTGAIYARFGDKRGVALAVHDRFAERSTATMDAWGARPQWADATPQEIIRGWTRGAVNFGRMYRPLLSLMVNDPSVREQCDEMMARPVEILTRLLRRAMPDAAGAEFESDVAWAARAALAIMDRLDLDDVGLCGRIEKLLCRMIGVD